MQELDLRMIFSVLIQKIKWIFLITVVVALLFATYTQFFVADTYRSEFQIYVSNYKDISSIQAASASGLTASQYLVKEYIVILKNDSVVGAISQELKRNGYSMSNSAIRAAMSMASVDETAMLNISVTTTDAQLSKAICDAVAKVAPDQLMETMELGSVKIMNSAKVGRRVGPNVAKRTILGALLGLVASCALFLLLYLLDGTVKDEMDLKQRLNVTVLGEVPSLQPDKRGGKKSGKAK